MEGAPPFVARPPSPGLFKQRRWADTCADYVLRDFGLCRRALAVAQTEGQTTNRGGPTVRGRLGVLRAVGVVLSGCLLAGAALSGCGGKSTTTAPSVRPSTAAAPSSTTSTAPTPSSTTRTTTKPTTTSNAPSAASELAAYFTAATDLDQRLKAAAVAANGSIGTAQITIRQSTLDAITAADPSPAAHDIPAGLTPDVLLPVLTVQSDLVSRFYAFHGFVESLPSPNQPGTVPLSDAHLPLTCLGNGSQAAASFPADLAAARSAAAHAPLFAAVDPSSRAAADLALLLQDILEANSGCASCGGARVTSLRPITWHHVAPLTPEGNPWDGDIGGILFTARYSAGQGWTIRLNAC